MKPLTERDIQITFSEGVVDARKFDDSSHGLSHCMKAVDFIVELADRYLFIEVKDPQAPQVPGQRLEEFIQEFLSGEIDEELKYKYRDSFLYEWASGRANKPIHYLILVGFDRLTDAILIDTTRALQRILPLLGPGASAWTRPIASFCGVFNIESWNRTFPDYPVTRRSAGAQA
ncbi:MAG: hypothetical protein OXC95_05705 [Dehalococcoidia bacterium]|nr:hypothetical protein [Dehalococcoidia bacterium]